MTKPAAFRMTVDAPSGNRGVFYLVPFAGDREGKHHFKDHNHARNFVRYLFSQSKAHPANAHTARNLYREFGEDARILNEGYVDRPKALLDDFLRRRFPARNAHEQLMDDGCYPFFILQAAGGPVISNFVHRKPGGVSFSHPALNALKSDLRYRGDTWGSLAQDAVRFAGKDPVQPFSKVQDAEALRLSEIFLHAVVRKLLGNGPQVLLTVAHRDQARHNPLYHIHRLVRKGQPGPGTA